MTLDGVFHRYLSTHGDMRGAVYSYDTKYPSKAPYRYLVIDLGNTDTEYTSIPIACLNAFCNIRAHNLNIDSVVIPIFNPVERTRYKSVEANIKNALFFSGIPCKIINAENDVLYYYGGIFYNDCDVLAEIQWEIHRIAYNSYAFVRPKLVINSRYYLDKNKPFSRFISGKMANSFLDNWYSTLGFGSYNIHIESSNNVYPIIEIGMPKTTVHSVFSPNHINKEELVRLVLNNANSIN